MRLGICFVILLMCMQLAGCVSGIRSPEARIDGTSDASFDKSFTEVLQPLSAEKRRGLALALLSVLLPQNCLKPDAVMALTFFPASNERKADIRSCRTQLNGESYQEIIDAGNAKGSGATVPARASDSSIASH
jgi:hypothetical protein